MNIFTAVRPSDLTVRYCNCNWTVLRFPNFVLVHLYISNVLNFWGLCLYFQIKPSWHIPPSLCFNSQSLDLFQYYFPRALLMVRLNTPPPQNNSSNTSHIARVCTKPVENHNAYTAQEIKFRERDFYPSLIFWLSVCLQQNEIWTTDVIIELNNISDTKCVANNENHVCVQSV
jgi:hypothetical protein